MRSLEVCAEAGGGADGDAALKLARGSFGLGDTRASQRETDDSGGSKGGCDNGNGDGDTDVIAGTRATAPSVSKDAFLPSSFGGAATRHSALHPSANFLASAHANSIADADTDADADCIRARAEHPYSAAIDALEACVSVAAPSDLFRCLMACVQRIYRRAAEIEAQRAAVLAQRRRRAVMAKMAATVKPVDGAAQDMSSSSEMAAQASDAETANQGSMSKETMQVIRAQRRGATVAPSVAAAATGLAMEDISAARAADDDDFAADEYSADRARSATGSHIGTGDDSSSFAASSMVCIFSVSDYPH
jgi:hypothetical protein